MPTLSQPSSPSKKSPGALRTSPSVWPLLESRTLGDFKVFSVRGERTRSPRSGRPHDFFVLECSDWANVVALTDSREVVLVRQFRAGTRSVTLEIPGGSVETGETAAAAVRRELREETGYAARSWRRLGVVHPNPAIQGNRCFTYLATGCRSVGDLMPDEGEDLAVELVPLRRIPDLIRKGRITHSLVIAAFHFLSLR
ncbi:MAG TPA: NUDIX hydrolase [Thermoanaerobaculia bacterium]|jgi:8-oxo-dGTP pyrophosphatase MutT (NUDIX family)